LGRTRFQLLRNKLHVFPKQSSLRGADKVLNSDEMDTSSSS
jgi:hypothetical protein